MTTIRTLTIAILATLVPLAARAESTACDRAALARAEAATPPADRCAADISRAEASAFEATRTQHACMDPDECRVARDMVAAAVEQKRTAVAQCPRETVADPFAPDSEPVVEAALDPDAAAFRAVMGVDSDEYHEGR